MIDSGIKQLRRLGMRFLHESLPELSCVGNMDADTINLAPPNKSVNLRLCLAEYQKGMLVDDMSPTG